MQCLLCTLWEHGHTNVLFIHRHISKNDVIKKKRCPSWFNRDSVVSFSAAWLAVALQAALALWAEMRPGRKSSV